MKLTNDSLRRFVGGQFEVQNRREGYIFCGEIEEIFLLPYKGLMMLIIIPAWVAEGIGYPPRAQQWVATVRMPYKANPLLYISEGIGDEQIRLRSLFTGESTILCPSGQQLIDPERVEEP